MKKATLLLGLLCLLFWGTFSSCTGQLSQNKSTSMNTNGVKDFGWEACLTAPRDYPIELHKGYFATATEFGTPLVNNGLEGNGWQEEGTTGGMGGRGAPSRLYLTWVSYAEKKFWNLDAPIDSARMLALLQKGYDYTDRNGVTEHITYKKVVIGLAPGGVVVIWLAGNFERVEVGRYQAKEVQVPVNEFVPVPGAYEDDKEFFDKNFEATLLPGSQAKVKKEGIPYGLWDQYRKKYNWRFAVQFYKEDKEDYRHSVYLNGEQERTKGEELNSFSPKALPLSADFKFDVRWAEAFFDDQEIMSAFKEITKDNPEAQVEIVGKVGFMYQDMTFVVKSGTKEIPLKKVEVKFWNRVKS